MAEWRDKSGRLVMSNTFTTTTGEFWIEGEQVPEAVWNEYQRVVKEREEALTTIRATYGIPTP